MELLIGLLIGIPVGMAIMYVVKRPESSSEIPTF